MPPRKTRGREISHGYRFHFTGLMLRKFDCSNAYTLPWRYTCKPKTNHNFSVPGPEAKAIAENLMHAEASEHS